MELKLDLLTIVQQLEDTPEGTEQFLSELLFFPEFQTFGTHTDSIDRTQLKLAEQVVHKLTGDALTRRTLPPEVTAISVSAEVVAADKSTTWRKPVALSLPAIRWEHGTSAAIAFVPMLGIEVVASDPEMLPEMLESHVLFELKRRGFSRSLLHLAYLARTTDFQIRRTSWTTKVKPPAERIKFEGEKKERILPKVGTAMHSVGVSAQAYCRDFVIVSLAKLLGGRHPTCILIIGETGVGKSAVTAELVRKKNDLGLESRPFWRTSGSRIVAGQTGFGMWQERCTHIIEEAKDTRAILCIGNLHELMQVGQSVSNSESIASFLRPSMVRTDLLVIAECTPGQLAAIEARDPKILDPYRRVSLEAPDAKTSREILKQINEEPDSRLPQLDAYALRKLDALHRRYMTYSAFPGRPARFLRGLRGEGTRGQYITSEDVTAAFSKETGLPSVMLDEAAPFDHARILDWFTDRIHAQEPAVRRVVDRLAIVKAQLSRPRQPLASFLFIGPTGVGKTELAKSVAEFLYGSKDRLLRLDMSEFGSSLSASRLVSSSFDSTEGILTSKVRDQPFSVILLDEFEKAHPDVFDLFLQVLGEGRLTDAAGRLADFSNSVIIMTSNLGATSYQNPTLGFSPEGPASMRDAEEHFLSVVKEKFRPEFFNRIDRVIPFTPLDHEAIHTIAVNEIYHAATRDGLTGRRITLQLTDAALDWIVAAGFDPRYGARPLKRAIEQKVLLPVAEYLNTQTRQGGTLTVDIATGAETPNLAYQENAAAEKTDARIALAGRIESAAEIRRDYGRLLSSPIIAEIESEKRRIEKQKDAAWRKAWRKHKRDQPDPHVPFIPEIEMRLDQLTQLHGRITAESTTATEAEEKLLVDFYANSSTAPPGLVGNAQIGTSQKSITPGDFRTSLIDAFAACLSRDDRITLTLLSADTGWLFELAEAYRQILSGRGAKVSIGMFRRTRHPKSHIDSATGELLPEPIDDSGFDARSKARDGSIRSFALQFRGSHSALVLAEEAGLHQRIALDGTQESKVNCLIQIHHTDLDEIRFPLSDLDRISTKNIPVRRQFDDTKSHWKDGHLQSIGHPNNRGRSSFNPIVLGHILEDTLLAKAHAALG